MANLNFPDSNKRGPYLSNISYRLAALLGLGLVIGSLPGTAEAMANPNRDLRTNESNVPVLIGGTSRLVNQQVEDFSFVQEPVIVGNKIIGVGRVRERLSVLEGAPGEDNTFYFVEKGVINDERIHAIAVDPKNRNRLVLLGDSGLYYSDNGWQSHTNFGSMDMPSHALESLRFSSDGEFAFMGLAREDQRNTVVFDPDSIPNFQVLEGSSLTELSSQPSTPRLQSDGTYTDYRMEKTGNGWRLRRHNYNLSSGQETIEDTPLGFRFSEGLVQILDDHITDRGSLRMSLIGPWVLTNEARRVEVTSFYEINPASGEILYSSSPEPGLYPLSPHAQESILAINGKAKDLSNGNNYLSVYYSGLDGNGEHTQGYGIELSTNSSPQIHARVRWPETDSIDYLGILTKSEGEQYLVVLTEGKLRSLRMSATEQNLWKQALLQVPS